jgi:tetratricopeptide (TPR) repeat protein
MSQGTPSRFLIGDKVVDLMNHHCDGQELTEQDCGLLLALVERQGEVVSKAELYRDVWGYRVMPKGRALDFAVRRLREKIEEDPKDPKHLEIVRGRGFRLSWSPLPVKELAPISFDKPPVRSVWLGQRSRVNALAGRIAEGVSILTVLGPAGVGKTRHLLEACQGQDVRWIRMHDIIDSWDFFSALCQAFQITHIPLSGALEELVDKLAEALRQRDASSTLILDGAEGLIKELRGILPVLCVAAPLRWVVTSRVRLELMEEQVFEIKPMDLESSLDFLQAKAQRVGVADVQKERLRPLARLLDGLPLAMELAAPRLRAMKPAALVQRLSEDIALLRDAPGLPVSLHEVIEDSLKTLQEDQFKALHVLSMLSRGVTLETAESLLESYGDGIDLVTHLVDQSLVLKVEQPGEPDRFRVMWAVASTMNRMSTENAREAWGVLGRYAQRWVREDGVAAVADMGERTLRTTLREEFVHAERWIESLVQIKDFTGATQLCLAFATLLSWEGDKRRAVRLGEELVKSCTEVSLRCQLWALLAVLAAEDQDWRKADDILDALGGEESHSNTVAVLSIQSRANVLANRGRILEALALFEEALQRLEPEGSTRTRAWLVRGCCYCLAMKNRPEDAHVRIAEMNALGQGVPDVMLQMQRVIYQGFSHFRRGEFEAAGFQYRKGARMALQLGNKESLGSFKRFLAHAHSSMGDTEGARRARNDALAVLNPERNANVYAPLLVDEALYLVHRGGEEQAIEMARQAMKLCGEHVTTAKVQGVLSQVCLLGFRCTPPYPFHDALDWLEELVQDQDDSYQTGWVALNRGTLAFRAGQHNRAATWMEEAWKHTEPAMGNPETVYMLGQLAALAAGLGKVARAKEFLQLAEKTFGQDGSWDWLMETNPWYVIARERLAEGE